MKPSAKFYNGKVVLISGSSGGIGKALAIDLLMLGAKVIINGRDKHKLNRTFEELGANLDQLLPICADISNKKEAATIIEQGIQHFGKLDILINNAGLSMRGELSELNPDVFEKTFSTNVFGTMNLTLPALKHIKKTRGSIIFISSLVAIRGLPGLSAYSASKMSLQAIAESLRIEESGTGIHVGLIQVGYTQIEHNKKAISPDGKFVTLKPRSNKHAQTTQEVSRSILKSIQRRRFITTLTFTGKIMYFLQKVVPQFVEWIVIKAKKRISEGSE